MRDQMVREGLSPRGGDAPVLGAGPAAGCSPTTGPSTCYDFQRPYARPWDEVKDWGAPGARPGLADVVRARAADDADRHLDAGRGVHRGDRAGHGRAHRAADHHAAVQPDVEGRGAARRRARVDRRAARWSPPAARSPRSSTTGSPTRSRRPTTRWSSPGSGSASRSPGRRGSATAMIAAAADAVAQLSDADQPGAPLLPPVSDLRPVSAAVAIAVAEAAVAEGLAQGRLDQPDPAGPRGHVAPGVPARRGQAALTGSGGGFGRRGVPPLARAGSAPVATENQRISVLIVEDEPAAAEALALHVDRVPGFGVAGPASRTGARGAAPSSSPAASTSCCSTSTCPTCPGWRCCAGCGPPA